MRKYKRVRMLKNMNKQQITIKNEKSTWKAIIKEKSEEIMNREIQKKT